MYNITQHMDENIFAFELKKKRKTGHVFIHIHTYKELYWLYETYIKHI